MMLMVFSFTCLWSAPPITAHSWGVDWWLGLTGGWLCLMVCWTSVHPALSAAGQVFWSRAPVARWHTAGSSLSCWGFAGPAALWTDSAALPPCSVLASCQPEAPRSCACPCSVESVPTHFSFLSTELSKACLPWPLPSSLVLSGVLLFVFCSCHLCGSEDDRLFSEWHLGLWSSWKHLLPSFPLLPGCIPFVQETGVVETHPDLEIR